jgi:hypothetical protein
MRGIQRREGPHTAGMLPGQPPANRSAPIVPNYGECLLAEAIGESDDIGRKVVEIIVAGANGLVAEIVASLIGRDDMESTLRQRWDLVTPAVPELGESVQKKYQRPIRRASFGDVKIDSVGRDSAEAHDVFELDHFQ